MGIVAGAVAVGVSQLVAAGVRPEAAPVVAVGDTVVDVTPAPVKNWAIATLGPLDKPALILGILVILAFAAAAIGRLTARRRGLGLACLAAFGVIGAAAALTRPDAGTLSVVPALLGAAAGAAALTLLTRLATDLNTAETSWPPTPTMTTAATTTAETAAASGEAPEPSEATPPASASPDASGKPAAAAATTPSHETRDPHAANAEGSDDGGAPARGDGETPEGRGTATSASGIPPEASGEPDAAASGQDTRPVRDAFGVEKAGTPAASRGGWDGVVRGEVGVARRRFLVGMGVGVGVAGLGVIGGWKLSTTGQAAAARGRVRIPAPTKPAPPLPKGVDLHVPGLSPFVTPNKDFYRVDTALLVPNVAPQEWTLRVHGLVGRPIELSFGQLLRRPLREADVTLTCVSNEVGGPYAGNARWLGAYLPDLLRQARVRADADMLLTTSSDGFTCGTPLDVVMDGRQALLAVAMNGSPLPPEHGFPVRQVVPGLYGYVSATKWIVDIQVTRFSAAQAYWTTRGWSARGPIKTESRIDVPRDGGNVKAGRVTVAGVAWAQHRGIERVEVRVDDGPWRPAHLAAVPGPDTWRQWSIPWDAPPGQHRIAVRATDATGQTQTPVERPPAPNGASGWHTITVTAG